MKTSITAFLLCALLFIGACNPGPPKGQTPTGIPNPPFQGEIPEGAMVSDGEVGSYGGTLVLALPSNPKSFNPITSSEVSTAWVVAGPIYRPLTDYDNKEQKDVPSLAESWETSPDGLIWTFRLRKGVRWSDGAPFTADDVVFTYQVTFDPQIASGAADSFTQSDGSFPTVEKVDDYTVRFKLKEPNALLVAAANAAYIVPKHKLEAVYKAGNFKQALTRETKPEDIVGLGPYRVVSFTADQRLVLERNPYYWKVDKNRQRLPYIDRVIFLIVPDFNTVALKFQSGETHMFWDIPPDNINSLKANEQAGDYTLYDLGPSFNVDYIVFNQDLNKYKDKTRLKWFREVKFRQAVSHAIDRNAIVQTAFQGYGMPTYGFISPANKTWYNDDIPKRPYDPDKARALLKEIGIEDRNNDGKLEDAEGHPIKFSINTNANRAFRVNIGTMLQDNLSKIGMDVSFQPLDFNLLMDKLKNTRDFDAIILGWQSAVPPDPILSRNGLLPGASDYYAFPDAEPSTAWEKRLFDLITQSSRTPDLEKRKQLNAEAMRIWSEYLPEIDLTVRKYFVAARNQFGNFKPSPLANYVYWNIDELYFTNGNEVR
ncbi:MAG TPA: ABC transporter substrate-binding protein [Blastocatellia bacterium]|nr:ABC transporter substrate-binding protein [Blastocatellia bacterium]